MTPLRRILPPPYTEDEIQRQPLIDPDGERFAMRMANIQHWEKWSRRFGIATFMWLGVCIGAITFLVVSHGG